MVTALRQLSSTNIRSFTLIRHRPKNYYLLSHDVLSFSCGREPNYVSHKKSINEFLTSVNFGTNLD